MSEYIFIKIPRTATSSMNQVLKQTRGHATAQHWKDKMGSEDFNKAFKFAVVRNPYERFRSAWYHQYMAKTYHYPDINEIAKDIPDEVVYRPQYLFVYNWKDELLVNKIYKYENLEETWKSILRRTDKPYTPLEHHHKSGEKPKLNKESKILLAEYYKEDFKRFGYEVS